MIASRERSLQAMSKVGITLTEDEVSRGKIQTVVNKVSHLNRRQKELVIVEFATRHWLCLLAPLYCLYPEFEDVLWKEFSKEPSLLDTIVSLKRQGKASEDAKARYCSYVRQMFRLSGKNRDEFYSQLFTDSGIDEGLIDIDFGESATMFEEDVGSTIHLESLLVWYSVKLLLKAYGYMYPTGSPLTEEQVEGLYSHFENAIPLKEKLQAHCIDDSAMKGLISELLPSISAPILHSEMFVDKTSLLDRFTKRIGSWESMYEESLVPAAKEDPLSLRKRRNSRLASGSRSSTQAQRKRYYPCAALLQSTGWGKSRLVLAPGRDPRNWIFYICLRGEGKAGQPLRTADIATLMESAKSVADVLRLMAGHLEAQTEGLADPQKPTLLKDPLEESVGDCETPPAFWKAVDVAARSEKLSEMNEASLAAHCRALVDGVLAISCRRVVFAIDEASALCTKRGDGGSCFQYFLDALLCFPRGVLGIVLDTSSRVHDLMPSKAWTAQMKAEGQHLRRMLPPFIFLTNRRIFEVPHQLSAVEVSTPLPSGSPSGTVTTNPFEVVPDARPLCGAYLNGAANVPASISDWRAIWAALISFIRRKMALGRAAMAAEVAKSGLGAKRAMDELALALLSIRLGMLNLDQAGVANLVANHMATLLAVSSDASVLYAQYVAEPIVAIAAFMEMGLDGRIEELLEGVLNLLNSGNAGMIFSAGDAGEFIASTVLMRGYDHAIGAIIREAPNAGYYVGMPVTLGTYFEALFDAKALAKATRKCGAMLLDSFVCVLQIIAVEASIAQVDLLESFRLRCGIICRRGQYAVDIIIPVLLATREDRKLGDLAPKDMSGLFVQVKNWRSGRLLSTDVGEIFDSVDRFAGFLPTDTEHLTLVMSVAEERTAKSTVTMAASGNARIFLSGVDASQSPCLSEASAASLKAIAERGSRQKRIWQATAEANDGMDLGVAGEMLDHMQQLFRGSGSRRTSASTGKRQRGAQ